MHEGHPVVEFPVTVGVVGALVAPAVAAAGAIAALLSHCTIEIERTEEAAGPQTPTAQVPPQFVGSASS